MFAGSMLEDLPSSIWHQEQPVTLQHSWRVLGAAMQGRYKVALTGQGSDELFGGYPWHDSDHLWRPLYGLPSSVRQVIARHMPRISDRDQRAIASSPDMTLDRYIALQFVQFDRFRRLLQPDVNEAIHQARATLSLPDVPEGFETWDRFQRMVYIEYRTRLPSFINRGLDAASMAESIEPRLPFLDHEFVELCLHIPPALRRRRMEKHLLRRACEPVLPAEIVWRKKRGLRAPDPSWSTSRGAPPDFVGELLSDDVVRAKGYFKPDAVRTLREKHDGVSVPLAAVLGFHLLDEMLVQGQGPIA